MRLLEERDSLLRVLERGNALVSHLFYLSPMIALGSCWQGHPTFPAGHLEKALQTGLGNPGQGLGEPHGSMDQILLP